MAQNRRKVLVTHINRELNFSQFLAVADGTSRRLKNVF